MKQKKTFTVILLLLTLISNLCTVSVYAEEDPNEVYIREMEEAKEEIEAVEEQIALGSLGFFLWHDPDSPAAQILLDRIENQYKDGWGNIELGAEGDATSLDNLYLAILFIAEGNRIRANDGYGETYPLLITDELMAVSEIQTTNSKVIMAHSRMYGVTECLAWGYNDPYSVWYDEEKALWLSGVTGWDVSHFLNLINPGGMYSPRITTGFAVVTRGTYYGATHGQVFGTSIHYPNAKTYTVSEYLEDFEEYYNGLKDRLAAAHEKYEKALSSIRPDILSLSNTKEGIEVLFKAIPGIDTYVILRDEGRGYEELARIDAEDLESYGSYLRYTDVFEDSASSHRFTYAVKAIVDEQESSYEEKSIERVRSLDILSLTQTSLTSLQISVDLGQLSGFEVSYSADGEVWITEESVYPFIVLLGLEKDKVYEIRVRTFKETAEGERYYSAYTAFKETVKE